MKIPYQNKFTYLRKSIVSILASNAFKAATLTPLALAMVACKTDTDDDTPVIEQPGTQNPPSEIKDPTTIKVGDIVYKGDVKVGDKINLSNIQITLDNNTYSAEGAYKYLKEKNATFSLSIKAGNETVISIQNDKPFPTNSSYTFNTKGNVNFSMTGKINSETLNKFYTITVADKGIQQGGENPEKPVDPQPITISKEDRETALKNIFGITDDLTGEVSSDINLTAQTIKVIGDISSGLKFISNEEIKSASENNIETLTSLREKYGIIPSNENENIKNVLKYYKENPSFITRDKVDYPSEQYRKITGALYLDSNGYINNPNGFYYSENDPSFKNEPVPAYTIKSDEKVKLSGNFYYDEIHLNGNGNISADEAIFTINDYKKYIFSPEAILSLYNDLNGENINYQKILVENTDTKEEHKYTFPKMEFYLYDENYQDKIMDILTLMDLYILNKKSDNIGFRNIAHDGTTNTFDGNKTKNKKLFVENTQQPGLPNVSATTIVEAAKTHRAPNFKNLQITGDHNTTKSEDINARFTNVIFEGDVSGIRNSDDEQFNGVVYFKKEPYNTIKAKSNVNGASMLEGMLKLDILNDNIKLMGGADSSVIDLRGIDTKVIYGYGEHILKQGGIRGVYYPNNVTEDAAETFNAKLADAFSGGFIRNAYSNNSKIYTYVNSQNSRRASSKTPRSLSEFEYFGNEGHFKKSAYESYSTEEFKRLSAQEQKQLKEDAEAKQIA